MSRSPQTSISVVVPVYNEANYIGECLEAVLSQSVAFDEILVIDNNSTDDTVAVVKKLAKKHAQISLLSESRQGVSYARMTGFDAATSEIVAQIDADTVLQPDWAKRMLDSFTDDSVAAVSQYVVVRDGLLRSVNAKMISWAVFETHGRFLARGMLFGSNMAVRRDWWLRVKDSYDPSHLTWEDLAIGLSITAAGGSVKTDRKAHASISLRRVALGPKQLLERMLGGYQVYARFSKAKAYAFVFLIVVGSILYAPIALISSLGWQFKSFGHRSGD